MNPRCFTSLGKAVQYSQYRPAPAPQCAANRPICPRRSLSTATCRRPKAVRMRPFLRQASISASSAVFISGEPGVDIQADVITLKQRTAALRNGAEQLVERVRELLHAVRNQFLRDLLQRDAVLLQLSEHRARARYVLLYGVGRHLTVVAERVHRRRRDGIHGVAADERLDIHRVLVGRDFWCWWKPRAGVASSLPMRPEAASAGRRTAPCSERKRVSHWRSPLYRAIDPPAFCRRACPAACRSRYRCG